MDAVIKILGRGDQVQHLVALKTNRFTIGRGYDNDLILQDPYLCARHLLLEKENEAWRAKNLSKVNGVKLKGRLIDENGVVLQSGDELLLGQTRLQLLDSAQAIAPARPLDRREGWILNLGKTPVWLGLILLVCFYFSLSSYLQTFVEFETTALLNPILSSLTPLMLLAGAWAISGRIFRHQSRFFVHLSTILLAWLGYKTSVWLLHVLGYNAGSKNLTEWGTILSWLLVSAAAIWVNLYLATNLGIQARNWAVAGIVALLLAFELSDEIVWNHTFSIRPEYYSAIEPPLLLFASGINETSIKKDLEETFNEADDLAKEAP